MFIYIHSYGPTYVYTHNLHRGAKMLRNFIHPHKALCAHLSAIPTYIHTMYIHMYIILTTANLWLEQCLWKKVNHANHNNCKEINKTRTILIRNYKRYLKYDVLLWGIIGYRF